MTHLDVYNAESFQVVRNILKKLFGLNCWKSDNSDGSINVLIWQHELASDLSYIRGYVDAMLDLQGGE